MKQAFANLHLGWRFFASVASGGDSWPLGLATMASTFNPSALAKVSAIKPTGSLRTLAMTPRQMIERLSDQTSWPYSVVWFEGNADVGGQESQLVWEISEAEVELRWLGGWASDCLVEPVAAELLAQLADDLDGVVDWTLPHGVLPVFNAANEPYRLLRHDAPPTAKSLAWPIRDPDAGVGPLADRSWLDKDDPTETLRGHINDVWPRLFEDAAVDHRQTTFALPSWVDRLIGAGYERQDVAVFWSGRLEEPEAPHGWRVTQWASLETGGYGVLRRDSPYGVADRQVGDAIAEWVNGVCAKAVEALGWVVATPRPDPTIELEEALCALGPEEPLPSTAMWLMAVRYPAQMSRGSRLEVLRHGPGPYPARSMLAATQRDLALRGSSSPQLAHLASLARMTVPNEREHEERYNRPNRTAGHGLDAADVAFFVASPDGERTPIEDLHFSDLVDILEPEDLERLAAGQFDPSHLPWAQWQIPNVLSEDRYRSAQRVYSAVSSLPQGAKIGAQTEVER